MHECRNYDHYNQVAKHEAHFQKNHKVIKRGGKHLHLPPDHSDSDNKLSTRTDATANANSQYTVVCNNNPVGAGDKAELTVAQRGELQRCTVYGAPFLHQ